ncbi:MULTISPECIES: hypothetical protein [Eisenbergiella]|uniref:Uncharacterized protein n=1 Tax=Eisenbergiella porci TaxID=2652274 RepID=A0A6N7WC71_9FIRM|nr:MULTISPECIES: hypothetical protein [Eisenbergiella]MCW0884537.1 hypothetical protein [Clostridioides difficile]MDY2652527.1 hypothetical protein [Eisenbergiella porci]MSS87335.1 hypothetical protein [Eisenbergiella porci]
MKKKHIILLYILVLLLSLVIPIIINESYKANTGYITLWEAKDVLLYFGSILGALGTTFIGVVALFQSAQANKISDRLLQLEERNSTPFLHIDTANCKIDTFTNREIDISIYFRNATENVINIVHVDELKIDAVFLSNTDKKIPFCQTWTRHYSVLPNQSRQMNFYMTSPKEEPAFVFSEYLYSSGFLQLHCELSITLGYANSKDIFEQSYEFVINIACPKDSKKYFAMFDGVENSIEKTNFEEAANN